MNSADQHRRQRARAEFRFRLYGILGLVLASLALCCMLWTIFDRGMSGFQAAEMKLTVSLAPDETGKVPYMMRLQEALKWRFPQAVDRSQIKELYQLLSASSERVLRDKKSNAAIKIVWVPASAAVDRYLKLPESERARDLSVKLTAQQRQWAAALVQDGELRLGFNRAFFKRADSRSPEQAGVLGAGIGSILTLIICLSIAFPLGVLSAIYLEEFARRGRWVDIIEVNINNLAAVPSIVFGLLGLAVYLNFMNLPRSAPLVGGMTLALMILPTLIISTRAAMKAVPPSIRDAARALGASPVQVVFHHVVPLAIPGIMTGTILGLARAIGETAPLLMIGMVAFIADLPQKFTDPATVLPVQIYLWASSPEAGFVEKTAAGIIVLLGLLLLMNAAAIYIRKRFEIRW